MAIESLANIETKLNLRSYNYGHSGTRAALLNDATW